MRTNPIMIYRKGLAPHAWAKWMIQRTMRKNQNNLISVVGKTGSGKTYSAISICEIMAKMDGVPFDVSKHVVFSFKDFMSLINSGIKRGTKIVCDEFQTNINANDYKSKTNKLFNYVLSTFRHRNLSVFFCTPFESNLDKSTRKLFHARFETMSINRKVNACRLKPRYIEYSDWKPDPYLKMLIISYKDQKGLHHYEKLFYWDIPLPNKENIKIYEEMKTKFTTILNKGISLDLDNTVSIMDKGIDAENKDINITNGTKGMFVKFPRKELTEKQEKVMRLFASGLKTIEIAEKIGVSWQSIDAHRRLAKKKGYLLEEFKQDGKISIDFKQNDNFIIK